MADFKRLTKLRTTSLSIKKNADIAEVLGMMEKANKDKYWALEQIQNRGLRVKVTPALSTYEILKACSVEFISELADTLRHLGVPEYEPPKYTNTYHWFFTDIVAGANPDITTNGQARKIIALNDLIQKTQSFKTRDPNATIVLPTGDGSAIGFKDSPEKPLILAIELHKALNSFNVNKSSRDRLDVRIGLDTGPVYPIKDLNDKENVWGPGIIYARRIMDLGRAKSILASDRFASDVRRLRPEFKKIMHLIGNYPVKHGEKIALYNIYGEIYGMEIGTKKNPIARRIGSSTDSDIRKIVNTFLFTNIDIILNVTNHKTMMTHHTWNWHMINQTSLPVDQVFYYIEGDKPRNFPDLNVKVTDVSGNELQIQNLSENTPYKKEFFVKLMRPFKPGQKDRFVKLEYDWEEPRRHFYYKFASECKKFRFRLSISKGILVKQKVTRVSPETGYREYASSPAVVRYLADRTEMEWNGSNIPAFDAYRFDW